MIKAIESNLFRIYKSEDYDDVAYIITAKDTSKDIVVYKEDLQEFIQLLAKVQDIL